MRFLRPGSICVNRKNIQGIGGFLLLSYIRLLSENVDQLTWNSYSITMWVFSYHSLLQFIDSCSKGTLERDGKDHTLGSSKDDSWYSPENVPGLDQDL